MRDDFLPYLIEGRREDVTYSLHKRITWDVNRSGIGIPYPTQNTLANIYTPEHCSEVITDSLLSRKALDLIAHATQVKEGRETGRGRRVDREEV